MKKLVQLLGFFVAASTVIAAEAPPTAQICVVMGTPGDSEYAPALENAVKNWQENAKKAGAAITVIGQDAVGENDPTDREKLRDWLSKLDPQSSVPVWLVYVGHGTYDNRDARLNLRNADVSATELAEWLKPLQQQVVFIHGGAASAPFVAALSGRNRLIVTATQSGREIDYARLGERISENVANPAADIDQDGQTSVLEALVTSNQQVQDFYVEADRMATEHAMLDDNGDRRGTPAEWFQGTRLVRRPNNNAQPDGDTARYVTLVESEAERALTPEQIQARAGLEHELEQLKSRKSTMTDADYYAAVEKIARQLGEIYKTKSAASTVAPGA